MRRVQDISETCTSPSIALLELDERAVGEDVDHLAGDLRADRVLALSMLSQGLGWICLRPSEMRSRSLSTLSTLTSISSSIFRISDGWFTRPQDMSVMCSSPSIPPRSTNAPKSVMFFT